MVVGNGGETPLYNGKAKNLHSGRSSSPGQKQLQMQFDAWMNNLNIARVPESVCKEMLEKGKGKAVADASGAKETMSNNNKSSIPIPTSHPMQQLESSAKDTKSSSAIKQVESNDSSGKFANESSNSAQNYQLVIPQGSNYVTAANFAEGNNYQGTPMQSETSEKTPVDPNQMQNAYLPNMVFNNNSNSNKEGNHEDSNGNNENNNIDNDPMIISPPPYQVPASSPGVWSDLNEIFPPLDPLGDDIPWTQKIQDTPIWEWGDLYFP